MRRNCLVFTALLFLGLVSSGTLPVAADSISPDGWRTLSSDWQFYRDQLLSPVEAARLPVGGEPVSLPHLWTGMADGGPREAYGVGTYARRIFVPSGDRRYALRVGKVRAVYQFYAVTYDEAGTPMVVDLGGNGIPGRNREATASGRVFVADLPPGDEVTLVLQVSNHIYSHAGFLWPPKMAPAEVVHEGHDGRIAAYFGFAGILVSIGIVTALLSFWHAGTGYYYIGGALLWVLASRVLIVNNYAWVLWPNLPLELALRLEYLGLILQIPLFYWLVQKLYPDEASKALAAFFAAIAGICTVVTFLAPIPTMFTLRDPYMAMSLFGLIMILTVFIKARNNNRNGARWAILCTIVGGIGAGLDVYFYIPVPRTSIETVPFAALAFTFVLLSLFTVRYRREQEEKEILALSLAKANDELIAHARKLEAAQAEAAAALDMKNSFLSNISHEVQTPLRAIVSFADRLIEDRSYAIAVEKRQEYLRLIRANGANLASLMDDILSVADLEIGRFDVLPSIVDAKRVCESAVAILEPAAHEKQLLVDIKCDPAQLRIDDRLMRQSLIKILSNAIKYSPPNGVVTIRGSRIDEHYVFTIMDTGPGMEQADIAVALSLFSRGGTDKDEQGGTGLGLPLVARFMDLLGGGIKIDSIPSLGTTVTLMFPISPTQNK